MPASELPTSTASGVSGPELGETSVTFRVPDPDRCLAGARLWQEVRIAGDLLDFHPSPTGWELTLERPPVWRMEYLLELSRPGGLSETTPDPGNPLRVAGVFGDKSVVEFPDYRPPQWLDDEAVAGRSRPFEIAAPSLAASVHAVLWSPAALPDDVGVPLLVVNDGPEYEALAGLTRYLATGIAGGRLPPLRAALLAPGNRNGWYSANDDYARELSAGVLPALTGTARTTRQIGMGTSLGALSMLHAQRLQPEMFDALFLQSGSFFHPRYDAHESGFGTYRQLVDFVESVLSSERAPRAVPVAMTCGAIEENISNNRLMAQALRAQGYDATLTEVPDVHNFTAWRDAFDPHLTRLLADPAGDLGS